MNQSSKPKHLFSQQKFTAMFCTQFLGAFNDNVFKQGLLLILTFVGATKLGIKESILNNLAAMLFILPYFLFSALAGQIADKYEKSMLTQKIKLLEILIMVMATIGFIFEIYWLLFVALFFMGTHSTFFGPIKYAYLPEVMSNKELVLANGFFQMGTSLAILTGMILAGFLTQLNHAFYWLSFVVVFIAILGYIASLFLPKTAVNSNIHINFNIISTSFEIVKYLYSLPLLFFIILGNSWYWYYGATFLTQTAEFGKVVLHGNESLVSLLLTLFSVGVALGSILCKKLSNNQVTLKLLPIGIIGLSIFAIDLYFASDYYLANNSFMSNHIYALNEIINNKGIVRIFMDLFLLGVFGGIYIVPLYAFMQAFSPISHRARIIGANNIFNALFMVLSAVVAMIIVGKFKLSIPSLFLITAIMNILFGVFLYYKLNQYKNTMNIIQHT